MSAIQLYARHTAGYEARVAHTVALLAKALQAHRGQLVQASSLGAEDMVLTQLLHQHFRAELQARDVTIATLDTGRLHEQTLALITQTKAAYGVSIDVYAPDQAAAAAQRAAHGELGMRDSVAQRKACCALRKLEPLSRMLAGQSAWLTGLRREQSAQRATVPDEEPDDQGRVKYNPLAAWSWADIWHHIATHGVPYNPLHDEFMPSIGCEPCTRAIAVGQDFRAGRWWWEDDGVRECGLHVHTPEVHPLTHRP